MEDELFRGTTPRVFVTNQEDPAEGRTLVWAQTRWYERLAGQSGAVAFPHIADDEEDLRERLLEEGYGEPVELDNEFGRQVIREFDEQAPLYPEAPETSDEPPFREQETE